MKIELRPISTFRKLQKITTVEKSLDKVRRRNSTAAEKVARSSVSSQIRSGLVMEDIQPPKTHSNIPMDR